jgi:NADPH:quinone reductase-like Zn-dependent oxidoreductase
MKAVVTDPTAASRLRIAEVPTPEPTSDQALVRVEAFSLNAGEVRTALEATESYVPGWDFAGVVEEPAANGSTPPKGGRVYGFVASGAWAEYVTASAKMMARVPDSVDATQAASLPVAAVTALASLESAGTLLGRRVLVTGAAGGVGRFACQLASLAGADVFAVSRRPTLPHQLRVDGVTGAVVFPTMADAKAAGRYDVILDGVGGNSLALALTALAPGGVCVTFGNGSGEQVSFHPGDFYHTPDARLQGLWLGNFMLAGTDCTPMLSRLIELVRRERLRPPVHAALPWTSIGEAAERLAGQGVDGKIILEIRP